ncbi:MAG: response regulator transcription factor [Terracidiphilus sp.]|jgi:DNA-binding NarL/FixJ family response regulator
MHILIADDHGVVRRGLKGILEDALPGADFFEATSGDEVLNHLSKAAVALLVLDISMPGRSGVDVLRDVKHAYPRLPVIILSGHPEEQYAVRCLRAGAAAYIHKESAPEELAIATRKILDGGRYISASLAEKLIDNLDEAADKPLHESLSDREHEVMKMIAAGVPLTDIGDALHVSVKTVSTYRARIMEKMQMKSNAELARYAMTQGLVD